MKTANQIYIVEYFEQEGERAEQIGVFSDNLQASLEIPNDYQREPIDSVEDGTSDFYLITTYVLAGKKFVKCDETKYLILKNNYAAVEEIEYSYYN